MDGGTGGSDPKDASIRDSASSVEAACTLEKDECVGAGCCPPMLGSRASEDRSCVTGSAALFCFDGPGIGCATDEELGCLTHDIDGGQEVFRTGSVTSDPLPAGWARCGTPLNLEVAHIGNACP